MKINFPKGTFFVSQHVRRRVRFFFVFCLTTNCVALTKKLPFNKKIALPTTLKLIWRSHLKKLALAFGETIRISFRNHAVFF